MTREEAIEFSYTQGNGDDSTVHEIYDDFESRTCSNCNLWGSCSIKLEDDSYVYFDKDFGCNQFKRKP